MGKPIIILYLTIEMSGINSMPDRPGYKSTEPKPH